MPQLQSLDHNVSRVPKFCRHDSWCRGQGQVALPCEPTHQSRAQDPRQSRRPAPTGRTPNVTPYNGQPQLPTACQQCQPDAVATRSDHRGKTIRMAEQHRRVTMPDSRAHRHTTPTLIHPQVFASSPQSLEHLEPLVQASPLLLRVTAPPALLRADACQVAVQHLMQQPANTRRS